MFKTVLGIAAAATIAAVSFTAPASAQTYHRDHHVSQRHHDFRDTRAFVRHRPVCTIRTTVIRRPGPDLVRRVRVCR